ncbi:peptidase M13 [Catenovulum sp. SM1970]|uniref:M13 family metallopeptidase n=1 Tax=Marinifaba aquimaris TaxID=2741323 RepID=UPI00157218E7|nr:M13-type metalloendopeptidase [Marinifaba aquimaris]NTS75936.1 peptidase M13 [Marinifaba aquimaris]
MNKISYLSASIVLALGLTACNANNSTTSTQTNANQITPVANYVSGIELANMDLSVKPQDDFYRFVNGQWLANTKIPADKSNYGSFTGLYEDSQQAMKAIIEKAAAEPAAKGSDSQKLGDFYRAYMNQALAEELGISPIADDLAQIAQISSKPELIATMAKFDTKGVHTPLGWFVNNDAKQSEINALYFTQSGLGLPDRDYYLKTEEKFVNFRNEYTAYIADMLKAVGHKNPTQAAKNVLALETQLAESQWTRTESRDANKVYNKMSTAEFDALLGKDIHWAEISRGIGFDKAQDVIVRQPSFFEGLGKAVSNNDVQVWKDYLSFHYVDGKASLLNKALVDRRFAFRSTTLSGITEQKPRWKKAVDNANGIIGEILGRLYVKEHFKPEAKARMKQLVDNLIQAYSQAIDELEWMSDETKKAAQAKLAAFTPKIGYPDKWKDYSALEIKADDLVGNYKRYYAWLTQEYTSRIGQPVDRSEWYMTPQTVNAYYNPVNNEIVFPAAILQPPFFNMEAEDAVNYGGIGAVIGHELGHGFDDQGAKYDGNGNLNNWWQESDLVEFKKRGDQLAAQFDAYQPFEDANVNGQFTLGENIGDLGGLSVAYRAYQISLQGQPSPVMDGYTGEQRFFMGWAQIWRRLYRDEELRRRLMTDPHSPSEYRVIGIIGNMPAFYQAFDVQEGDNMYIAPEERVKIW